MKGIIFNLFEQFVGENYGADYYERLLNDCRLATPEPFIGPGTYPDGDFMMIISSFCDRTGKPVDAAVRQFGRYCFPKLLAKVPEMAVKFPSSKKFIKAVGDIIHVEVNKLYDGAKTPEFVYRKDADGGMVVEYRSERKLCRFMEGLLEGLGEYFNETVNYKQRRCLLSGDECCEFALGFSERRISAT